MHVCVCPYYRAPIFSVGTVYMGVNPAAEPAYQGASFKGIALLLDREFHTRVSCECSSTTHASVQTLYK